MSGPFENYAWGFAYESMHKTMLRMKDRDPHPMAARDEQLTAMWVRAYEAYKITLGIWEINIALRQRLQGTLYGAMAAGDVEAIAVLTKQLEGCDMTLEEEAAVEERLARNVETLEAIDVEFARRPWLQAPAATEHAATERAATERAATEPMTT